MSLLLLALLPASALFGQPMAAPVGGGRVLGAPPGPSCDEGLIKDDGTVETGWSWVPSVIRGEYVQEFNSGELPTRIVDRVCLCFLRTRDDADLDFDLVFYRQHPEGVPEAVPFAVVPGQVRDLPMGVANSRFVEVATGGVEVPAGIFYVGARWNASIDQFFFICADTTPATPRTNLWWIDDRAEGWDNAFTTIDPIFAQHRAAMIRPVAAAVTEIQGVDVPVGASGLVVLALGLAAVGLLRLWRA